MLLTAWLAILNVVREWERKEETRGAGKKAGYMGREKCPYSCVYWAKLWLFWAKAGLYE